MITLLVELPYRHVRLPRDFDIAEGALPHRVFGTHAIFLLLLTLHKLLIMQHFFNLLLLLLSPVCTISCAQKIVQTGDNSNNDN